MIVCTVVVGVVVGAVVVVVVVVHCCVAPLSASTIIFIIGVWRIPPPTPHPFPPHCLWSSSVWLIVVLGDDMFWGDLHSLCSGA